MCSLDKKKQINKKTRSNAFILFLCNAVAPYQDPGDFTFSEFVFIDCDDFTVYMYLMQRRQFI